ncbi:MAG TPA: protein kinase [Vicinamibacterales bacterium]|nr:protein kinase [Vicinamibacterales bacterium]
MIEQFGPYRVLDKLGAGGMGEVYRAHDTRLARDVAVKILPAHLTLDPVARERLRREAVAAAALDHPFICKVFEIGEADSRLFIVMEYVAGETLLARLSAGPIPLGDALRIAGEVVEALETAHARQIIHRDLKPANVMLSSQGHVKVMDFGLAKDLSMTEGQTQTVQHAMAGPLTGQGERVGTPAYMSPEQIVGDMLDARSDIFSLGVVLCELVSGVHPFHRPTTAGTVTAVLREAPVIVPSGLGEVPSAVRQILQRMLAKDPQERYQSVSDLRRDLSGFTAGGAVTLGGTTISMADRIGQERRWPMVGRETERGDLLKRLDDAIASRGSLVMIGGEPGIGKTRLTEAVLDEARRKGCLCLVGHAYEMEGAPPYVPFVEMLEYAARAVPATAFRHALGESASEISKFMPDLRRMFPDIPPPLDVPAEQQRWRLFNAYRDFVDRSCKMAPIVVVLEDLHWADEPSLQLLLHIAPAFVKIPLLVLGTYRDVELDVTRPFAKVLETLLRQRHATRMSLRRLPASGVTELLAAMSGRPAPDSLARVIFRETEGNPFFVEEVFQHLKDEGQVFDASGAWRTDLRVETLDVPEGVRLVIGRRLERLGETTRRVLTTAAVIGRSFSLSLLESLEEAAADAVLDAVEEAERAHLLAPQQSGRETRYLFAHELIRQTLADALSLPRRQRLHARIAAAIERTYAHALDKHVSALAHHLYNAGAAADAGKASTYLLKAADESRAAAAHEDALRHLDNALTLWEDEQSDRVADVLARRGLVLRSLGRPDEAIAAQRRAWDMWDAQASMPALVTTTIDLSGTYAWQARPGDAAALCEMTLTRLGAAPPEARVPLLLMRAIWQAGAGNIEGGLESRAAAEAERARAKSPMADFMAAFIEPSLLWFRMDMPRAVETGRAFSRRCEAEGQPWYAADIDYVEAFGTFYLGRHAETREVLDAMEARAERVGHQGSRVVLRHLRGLLRLSAGDIAGAVPFFEEANEIGRVSQNPWAYFPELTLGILDVWAGRHVEGLARIQHVADIEPSTYWCHVCRPYLFANLAGVDPARAEAYRRTVTFTLPRTGVASPVGAWLGLQQVVEGLALMGRREELAPLHELTEALVATGVLSPGSFSATVQTTAGIAAAAAGRLDLAETRFQMGIDHADAHFATARPGARLWFADMLARRGGPGDRDRAKALANEAIALANGYGMVAFGHRAHSILGF